MVYIIIAVVCLLLILLIIKDKIVRDSSPNPRVFAKSIAEAQLLGLRAVKEEYPDLSTEEQYFQALSMGPTYSDDEIREVIAIAKTPGKSLKFYNVVHILVTRGYRKGTGDWHAGPSFVLELREVIRSVIPDDL